VAVCGTLNGSTGRIRIERIGDEADDSSIVQCGRQKLIDDNPDRGEQMNKNALRDLGRVSRDIALLLLVVRPRQALGIGIRRAFDAQLASQIRLPEFLTSSSRVILNGVTRTSVFVVIAAYLLAGVLAAPVKEVSCS